MKSRQISFIVFLVTFIGLINVDSVKVSAAGGTFGCEWNVLKGCIVNTIDLHCDPGYKDNGIICLSRTETTCGSGGEYACIPDSALPSPTPSPSPCVGPCLTPTPTPNGSVPPFDLCKFAGPQEGDCKTCLNGNSQNGGVWTAVGCIHFAPTQFITDFMKIALGIAGGIALLLMIYGSFLISVSTGDPKKAQEGQEIITGTIAGLLFIIFSVFLLKLIGVDILQIPGL